MLKQPLQQKQIADSKWLVPAGRRHVARHTREGCKDFARGVFAVPIEGSAERRRSTLGDGVRDPSRILIRRRGVWLASAHHTASANRAMIAGSGVSVLPKSAKSTPQNRYQIREAEPPLTPSGGWMRYPAAVEETRRRCRTKSYHGAPRARDMGTIVSPRRYDWLAGTPIRYPNIRYRSPIRYARSGSVRSVRRV